MRIIKKLHLREYAKTHAKTAGSIEHWIKTTEEASWLSLQDVKGDFRNSSVLGGKDNRVRFEISGGRRLIVGFDFERQAAFIKFIGTHEEYDQIDANQVADY